ncbi:hypothetical protein PED39_02005 [Methanomassiliicoccales archaeon LGM-RCC1]|nr:hypothetical protein PED39_02005 [Methanomassiliicoccales archaeon LGM-RCC1]
MIDEKDYQIGMLRLERIVERNRTVHDADDRWCVNECKLCGYIWNAESESERPNVCPMCRSSLWDRPNVRKVMCYRCGHEWITSSESPMMCPSCKSRRWKNELLPLECCRCGSTWEDTFKQGVPVTCPKCGVLKPEQYKVGRIHKKTLRDVTEHRNNRVSLDESILKEMWGIDEDLFRSVCLRKHGLTSVQADIIVKFDRGESVPDIASDMSVSVSTVMDVVLPFMRLCESMGVRTWS